MSVLLSSNYEDLFVNNNKVRYHYSVFIYCVIVMTICVSYKVASISFYMHYPSNNTGCFIGTLTNSWNSFFGSKQEKMSNKGRTKNCLFGSDSENLDFLNVLCI